MNNIPVFDDCEYERCVSYSENGLRLIAGDGETCGSVYRITDTERAQERNVMPLEVDTAIGPAHWASALVNGDDSGFDASENADEERAALDRWVARLAADGWYVVSVTDEEPYFTSRYREHGGTANGGDVCEYVIHRQRDLCPLCGEDRNHPSQHGKHRC